MYRSSFSCLYLKAFCSTLTLSRNKSAKLSSLYTCSSLYRCYNQHCYTKYITYWQKLQHSYENSSVFCLYSDLGFKNYLLDNWGIFGKVLEVIHSVMVFWLVDENICPYCWLTHIIFGRKVFPWNRIGRQLWRDFL